jgi:hypothetical protein
MLISYVSMKTYASYVSKKRLCSPCIPCKLKNNYTKLSNMQHLSKLFFRVTIPKVLFSENLFLPLPVFSEQVFYRHYNVLKPCIWEDKLTIAIYISQ